MNSEQTNNITSQPNENPNSEDFIVLIKRFIPMILVLALLLGLWAFFKYGCKELTPIHPAPSELSALEDTTNVDNTNRVDTIGV